MDKNSKNFFGFVVSELNGTYGLSGPPDFSPLVGELGKVTEEECWTLTSTDKSTLGIFTDSEVRVFRSNPSDGQMTLTSVCPTAQKTVRAKFSMSGGFLSTFAIPNSPNFNNFKLWDLRGSKIGSVQSQPSLLYDMNAIKFPDFDFSPDDKTFARMSNNSIQFFQVPDFDKIINKTPDDLRIANFSISPVKGGGLYFITFIRATTGPSSVRLFSYPDLVTPIASKSFFQASRVRTVWSPDGASVLIVTAAEIDKTRTGEPMYGNTLLHFMNIKGVAMSVTTGGSSGSGSADSNAVHAVEWSPTSTEFCLITGATPRTRAVLMNNKCEKVFDIPMSASARNLISFNPGGTHLLLCTAGVKEKVECWEVKGKRSILQLLVPDVTHLFWLNDGTHFLTATMSPQMVLRNGFKIWDSTTGKCVKEWTTEHKLLGITPLLVPLLPSPSSGVAVVDQDKDKQIRGLRKKLGDINKLKEILKTGKTLEKNQLDKLTKEQSLVAELRALELS